MKGESKIMHLNDISKMSRNYIAIVAAALVFVFASSAWYVASAEEAKKDPHVDLFAEARDGFIDGVVDHFVDEVVESVGTRGPDVHRRPFPYRVEAFEALEPYDAVIIGDVDSSRRKLMRLHELGVDRLMCLMQMGPLPHEVVMRSIRDAGECLIPEMKDWTR